MLHPHTRIHWMGDHMGYGVVATQRILKGTMVYSKDAMEISFPPHHPILIDLRYKPIIDFFSYQDGQGNRILSWDAAKFINHSCESNTLSTGYGFEIAVRDIEVGEEITDDYGMFLDTHPMKCLCGSATCRESIDLNDYPRLSSYWDNKVRSAFEDFKNVPQALWTYLEPADREQLDTFLKTGEGYIPTENDQPLSHVNSPLLKPKLVVSGFK